MQKLNQPNNEITLYQDYMQWFWLSSVPVTGCWEKEKIFLKKDLNPGPFTGSGPEPT